jgi:hypothetical protein
MDINEHERLSYFIVKKGYGYKWTWETILFYSKKGYGYKWTWETILFYT